MKRVLVVEDQPDLAEGLRRSLQAEGYDVEVARFGERGLEVLRLRPVDLVLLDLMLPDISGFEFLETLRAGGSVTPVLILTARGAEFDTLTGFRLGADDYVVKPFRLLELLARVRALLRRASGDSPHPAPGGVRAFGDIVVDCASGVVTRQGSPVALRPKEYELLVALLRRDGEVVSRSELLREVWGYAPLISSRTVDTHMLDLRKKLEVDPRNPRHLMTARTRGYRLVP